MTSTRCLLLLLIGLLMSGCGYQLRGSLAMPESLKNVYVFNASSPLQTELQAILKSSRATMANSPNEAGIVVKVLKEDIRSRVLSIGSAGKTSESELNYYLQFQFYDSQEHELMEEQTIEIAREYFNDQSAVLARSNEDLIIRKEIYKQASRMLLARARVAAEKLKK
jgi:LPS-assembly lipoprotein